MKILIVDDTSMMRFVLKEILIHFADIDSENIFEAGSGIEAIRRYKLFQPDAVFLDIAMPDLDGIEALKELMKLDPAAKVIMITASGEGANVRKCLAEGALDYIIKPPSPERVVSALKKAFTRVIEAGGGEVKQSAESILASEEVRLLEIEQLIDDLEMPDEEEASDI